MAIWDYRPKADLGTVVIIGVGLFVAPVVIPMIAAAAKPVAKAAIKGGIMVYEKSREMCAEIAEAVENLAVEARSEVQAELAPVKGKRA